MGQEGISIFNRKPKKGIEFLINAKKLGNSPEEIAEFLKSSSGLNKTLIGDFLGEREEMSLKVMHAYVDSFDFNGMEFDEAIRTFLQGFRLPGEAQKIDRIMEKFAERYCKCNPMAFTSADTAYVLAYSVIMLNTDAHNDLVKNKVCHSVYLLYDKQNYVSYVSLSFLCKVKKLLESLFMLIDSRSCPVLYLSLTYMSADVV